jgi:hypothetical protein
LGIELHLALLTSITNENKHPSLLDIYPNKHEALSITGQLKADQKMRSLHDILVLDDESWSGPTRLEKQLHAINKLNSFFIVKCAHLGTNQQLTNQVFRCLRNEFQLKWLCPCVIYSRHSTSQEKSLDDLKQKTPMGHHRCQSWSLAV